MSRYTPFATVLFGALAALVMPIAPIAPMVTTSASAAPMSAAGAPGWARFGHFAPSEAPVDVFVDGEPFAMGVAFKTVSDYKPLAASLHRFEVRSTGQAGAPDLIDVKAGVAAGRAVTIGAVTTRDGVASQVYDDALAAPPAGQSLVRFIHAAPDVAAVDVRVTGGPVLASEVRYPAATDYQSISPGTYDVEVDAAGGGGVVLNIRGWSIQPGSQSSIVIIKGLDGQIDVAPIRDAAAVASAPVGGVQTDLGRMASAPRHSTTRTSMALGSSAAAFLVVAASTTWRKRRSRVVGS